MQLERDELIMNPGLYTTTNQEITKTVTEEKWNKGKGYIEDLINDLKYDRNRPLEYKRLE